MKKTSNIFSRFWKILGPGLVTGASDDDPSGIATYSQAGAAYGLATLWTAFITFPLMASIQEMCARIGLATSHGLAGTLKSHNSKPVLYLMLLLSFPIWVKCTCSDRNHPSYLEQQKNNGQKYKRNNFQHPWIYRPHPDDRGCCCSYYPAAQGSEGLNFILKQK